MSQKFGGTPVLALLWSSLLPAIAKLQRSVVVILPSSGAGFVTASPVRPSLGRWRRWLLLWRHFWVINLMLLVQQ